MPVVPRRHGPQNAQYELSPAGSCE
jgi:hypothetical protein